MLNTAEKRRASAACSWGRRLPALGSAAAGRDAGSSARGVAPRTQVRPEGARLRPPSQVRAARGGGAVSCRRSPTMAAPGGLGRCVAAFWLALAFDAVGLAVLLAGVFADVFFADLLIYAGGIGIFLSLIWWVFWYAGNLEVSPEELRDDVGLAPPKGRGDSVLRGLVHGFSLRLSSVLGTASRSRRAADLELQRARGPPRHSADGSRRVVRGGGLGRREAGPARILLAVGTAGEPCAEAELEGKLVVCVRERRKSSHLMLNF